MVEQTQLREASGAYTACCFSMICLHVSLKMLLHWPYMSRRDLTLGAEDSCAGSRQPTTGQTAWATAYQQERVLLV